VKLFSSLLFLISLAIFSSIFFMLQRSIERFSQCFLSNMCSRRDKLLRENQGRGWQILSLKN
jgi:hypothetical protein